MRSLSCSFSRSRCSSACFRFSSRSCSILTTSGSEIAEQEEDGPTGRPARRRLFSSSSSATLRSRLVKWAFRLSREFCAAMRFLCARASLRSSGDMAERGRLRGGSDMAGREREVGSTNMDQTKATSLFFICVCICNCLQYVELNIINK